MHICLYVQGKLKNDAPIDTWISSDAGTTAESDDERRRRREERRRMRREREREWKEKGATTWIDHCRCLISSRHLTLHITNILCFSSSASSYSLINHSICLFISACFLSVSIQPETIECRPHKQIRWTSERANESETVHCRSNRISNRIMLTNERQRQHRSVLQTSKIKDIFKPSVSGTLSPLTTATTSSGYSTGGSSTSTAAISLLKKSTSSSIGLKTEFPQQQQQQQQRRASSKTKPKGRQEKNMDHVGKVAIDAQMVSIALSQMTFPVCFFIEAISGIVYPSSNLCKQLSVYLLFHSLPRENQQRCDDRPTVPVFSSLEERTGPVRSLLPM